MIRRILTAWRVLTGTIQVAKLVTTETVELRDAWQWTCPECGRDNYEPSMVCNEGDEENGRIYSAPDKVMCKHCPCVFEAENPFQKDLPVDFDDGEQGDSSD